MRLRHDVACTWKWGTFYAALAFANRCRSSRRLSFRFTGKLNKPTLMIDRPKPSPEDENRQMMESRRNNRMSEWFGHETSVSRKL
jgi:hypothetical protein